MTINPWTIAVDLTGFASSGLEDFSEGVPQYRSRPTFRILGISQTGAILSSRSSIYLGRNGVEVKVRVLGQDQLLDRVRAASIFEMTDGPIAFARCELISVDAVKELGHS